MIKPYGFCAYCANWRRLTIDHVIPKSSLGYDRRKPDNFLLVCTWCNKSKGSRLLDEWVDSFDADAPQLIWAARFVGVGDEKIREYYLVQKQSCVYG